MLRLFQFFKPYVWNLFWVIVFLFVQSLAELYLPTLMSDVVNDGMMKGNSSYIWKYGSYMLLVALGSSLCSIVGSYLSSIIGVGFGRDIRDKVFSRVESYSLQEFDKIGTASLITRTTNDVIQVQTLIVMGLRFMVYAPIMCVGGIIMAFSKDKQLTLILAVVLPVMLLLIASIASVIVPLFKSMQVKLDKVNLVLRENLTGIRVIRAFNRLKSENERFEKANRDLTETSIKVNKIMAAIQPIMIILMNFTSIAIIWFGGHRISQNEMQVGDMMAFLQYAMQVMFSIIMVTIMFVMVPRAQASATRINEVLDMEPKIVDPLHGGESDGKRGYVEFRDVTFSYPGAEMPAIRNISFAAYPGEVTAIIGGTGSGKSTLINLIPRFYDVDSGSVLVDGADVRQMNQKDLRAKIGFVPQTPILFSGTVSENIRYGKTDASDEEITHAADVAQASEFISKMKEGYNSQISQGGTNLSGGQKQRLSIARALVRKPGIYILDDSFSALDFKTDAQLRAALKKETVASTVIIVAQRAGTVMDADRIIVLDEGRIEGIGKHKELMSTCSVYREIVSSQLSGEEIA
ncbi:MAG: putative ABC transporter ATP-binding protein [Pelotomaculum sp. PtaB.Bin013]|uniref:ABC transporter ATP-binding protein/permease n=1 Tax=Pelotomaculum isophthalicicum JI TaxID=947010 RepID=A0A9X4H3N4_9FIRM|nr:ABC transporter ATP-binding protein [Pelotomaculum isophthalicicum]MDF9409750.1 ABC transporter ATP-binding protein/permease [Pelotomaculum isophthalicicum JI]OPX90587.1 MAG: putative ABC transporter ATP-binding protein [Pelotomaculum sp. PtaB.Bin013]